MPRSFVITAYLILEGGLAVSARPLAMQERWPFEHPLREGQAPSNLGLSPALVDPNGNPGINGLPADGGTIFHDEFPVILSHSPSFLT
jgi:hypothetical protein